MQGGSVRSEILTKSAVLAEEVFTLSDAPPSHSESSSETETETETIPQRKVESETDLSALPTLLQNYFDRHGSSQSIRPGIIRTGPIWQKRHQDNFFTPSREIQFNLEDQQRNKHRAFDLLDALTRSGGLTIDDASVHVILASSHYFPQTLLETVIERNMNPLIKLEESTLLMSSIIHNKKIEELIVENEKKVIQTRHTIP